MDPAKSLRVDDVKGLLDKFIPLLDRLFDQDDSEASFSIKLHSQFHIILGLKELDTVDSVARALFMLIEGVQLEEVALLSFHLCDDHELIRGHVEALEQFVSSVVDPPHQVCLRGGVLSGGCTEPTPPSTAFSLVYRCSVLGQGQCAHHFLFLFFLKLLFPVGRAGSIALLLIRVILVAVLSDALRRVSQTLRSYEPIDLLCVVLLPVGSSFRPTIPCLNRELSKSEVTE